MLQVIVQELTKEDTHRIFSSQTHPTIYEIADRIQDPQNIAEIETVFKTFFSKILHSQDPNSFVYLEAIRMLNALDRIILSMTRSSQKPKDINDEMVDIYMESLRAFASGINEKILDDHIAYLDN